MMKLSLSQIATAALGIGIVAAAGINTAYASPLFKVNPSSINGSIASATGDNFKGSSTELLHLFTVGDSNATLTTLFGGAAPYTGNYGQGFFTIDSLNLGNSAQNAGLQAGLFGGTYNLYVAFNLIASLNTGSNGASPSTYNLQALNFGVYADPHGSGSAGANVYTQASGNGLVGTEASIAGTADDILLGVGSLIAGSAAINSGGVALNAFNGFAVCDGTNTASVGGLIVLQPGCTNAGTNYFFDPTPFYKIVFSAFNNTATNTKLNSDGTVAITDAVATVDFVNVPEPGSLALMGVALAGLGVTYRRKSADKKSS